MATPGQWWQGARPRTLPAALAPVLVGTAVAWWEIGSLIRLTDGAREVAARLTDLPVGIPADHSLVTVTNIDLAVDPSLLPLLDATAATTWVQFVLRAVLALVVALALQVGVNYANDYSDGIRGTDDARVGPVRLVGQGLASPRSVKLAAFAMFGVAALAGLALVLITQAWWLLLVGAAAIVAAWFYTGGPSPYGYAGLGEAFVFVFFGLVAVVGTTYVQTLSISWLAVAGGVACGSLSVGILLANNLRDIPTDTVSGKRTLAVRLGDARTRAAYLASLALPFGIALGLAPTVTWWALLALLALPLALRPAQVVRGGALGRDLVPVLAGTGKLLLGYAVLLSLGLVVASF
ncbi:1,4-dihydroxy-2-naphthoate polyprenyltransferase [Longivirga aurantiaca]|uniref:1,4-dihydroxy-2-naphthoate octaprenyltransferase n=1 Tax=Longivirga aurantiaca TaxID=1837743 RepID=A0ABW1SYK5_9ACTN